MNKFIYAFSFLLLTTTASIAQQHRYALKIGLHGGLSNYYGDLSHQVWDLPHQLKEPIQDFNFLSYGISVEYHVSRTFGLRLWGMKSQFKASDRTYENSATYNRALNVQTDLLDASLLGIVYFDNDLVLNSRAAVAPYFMFGGGLTHFETKGDLLSEDNNRYHYWSDNTIRTEAETGLNAGTAALIEQDYSYETALQPLNTENANYNPITWNVALGLGVKFRLSSRFHLHLEALVRYTGSDYLDDVSGAYRSNYTDNFQAYAADPSAANRSTRGSSPEMNDWYTFVGLSAHYSFGQKTYKIRPSIIYTENLGSSSSLNKTTNTANSNENKTNNNSTQGPSNTTGSDTTVQKVTTTTTTIKTVTVDTFNNSSSSIEPQTTNRAVVKVEPIPTVETIESVTNKVSGDSISQIIPNVASDTLLKDSVETLVVAPNTENNKTAIPLAADTIAEPTPSPTVTTVVNNPAPKADAPTTASKEIMTTQNTSTAATNPVDAGQIRALEIQEEALAQKHQYELLLQKERYERQLSELKLQKDLERERQRSTPNSKEQELQYQLKLEQQKLANELEKQKLLNQLAVEKNRPAPDTKQDALQLQQQKYEADLKLQQQAYEHKLEIQALQNQLNLEQLKKAKEGTGTVNSPAPSTNTATTQELERLSNAIEEQNNRPVATGSDTVIIINNNNNTSTPTNSNATVNSNMQEDLLRMEVEQQALLLKIKDLEAANQAFTKDTITIVQRDSIFVGNGANAALTTQLNQQQVSNNSLTTKLALAQQKSKAQQSKIDSLQSALKKVESEKKVVAGKLGDFLTQKKGTYITKIYFDVAKSSLTVQAKETLTTLAYYLEKYPTVQFMVKGFASKTGRTDVNERLSAERASEVANFLKQSGIAGERIKTTPLGEQDSNSSNELDRRAEVHLSF